MEPNTIDAITSIVGSLGFPIFTAWYFMSTLNKTMQKNTEILMSLKDLLIKEQKKNE